MSAEGAILTEQGAIKSNNFFKIKNIYKTSEGRPV